MSTILLAKHCSVYNISAVTSSSFNLFNYDSKCVNYSYDFLSYKDVYYNEQLATIVLRGHGCSGKSCQYSLLTQRNLLDGVCVKIIQLSETLLSRNNKKQEKQALHNTVSPFSSFNQTSNPKIKLHTCCTKLTEVYG